MCIKTLLALLTVTVAVAAKDDHEKLDPRSVYGNSQFQDFGSEPSKSKLHEMLSMLSSGQFMKQDTVAEGPSENSAASSVNTAGVMPTDNGIQCPYQFPFVLLGAMSGVGPGSEVSVRCLFDMSFSDGRFSATLKCSETGEWELMEDVTCVPVICAEPNEEEFEIVTRSDIVTPGSTIEVACAGNRYFSDLAATEIMTCNDNGHWVLPEGVTCTDRCACFEWTGWLNSDTDYTDDGDYETLGLWTNNWQDAAIGSLHREYCGQICVNPISIEVRVAGADPPILWNEGGDRVHAPDPAKGFICRDSDQEDIHGIPQLCHDYDVRLLCPSLNCRGCFEWSEWYNNGSEGIRSHMPCQDNATPIDVQCSVPEDPWCYVDVSKREVPDDTREKRAARRKEKAVKKETEPGIPVVAAAEDKVKEITRRHLENEFNLSTKDGCIWAEQNTNVRYLCPLAP